MPISRASVASARSSSRSSCASTSGSRPSSSASLDEVRERVARVEDREQQDEVGAGGAQHAASWRASTTNSLARTGIDDRGADRAQVVDRTAEPVRLAQDGDRGRATGLVGARPRDDVLVGRRDPPADGERSLDLRDQVQAGRGEPFDDRPRRRRGRGATYRSETARRELGVSTTSAARVGARRSRRRRSCRRRVSGRHASTSAGLCGERARLGRSRSARSRSSSSVASPASIVSAARVDAGLELLDRRRPRAAPRRR